VRYDRGAMQGRPQILRNAPLLEDVPLAELLTLAELVQTVELQAGQTLVVRGQPSPGMVLVESGSVEVSLDASPICSLSPGSVFSEESLLADSLAPATLRASAPSRIGILDRASVDEQIESMPHLWEAIERAWRQRVLLARLHAADLLQDLSDDARRALAEAFEAVDLLPGDELAQEGKALDCLYVIREGQAELSLAPGSDPEVVPLRAGDCVGGMALLEDYPQPATVRAPMGLRALKLTRSAFAGVLDRFPGALSALRAAVRRRSESAI